MADLTVNKKYSGYRLDHPGLQDVYKSAYIKGTIKDFGLSATDPITLDDTVTVEVNGEEYENIPLFYHTRNDDLHPESRKPAEEGGPLQPLKNAAWSFMAGDEVKVMMQENAPVAVLGLWDNSTLRRSDYFLGMSLGFTNRVITGQTTPPPGPFITSYYNDQNRRYLIVDLINQTAYYNQQINRRYLYTIPSPYNTIYFAGATITGDIPIVNNSWDKVLMEAIVFDWPTPPASLPAGSDTPPGVTTIEQHDINWYNSNPQAISGLINGNFYYVISSGDYLTRIVAAIVGPLVFFMSKTEYKSGGVLASYYSPTIEAAVYKKDDFAAFLNNYCYTGVHSTLADYYPNRHLQTAITNLAQNPAIPGWVRQTIAWPLMPKPYRDFEYTADMWV